MLTILRAKKVSVVSLPLETGASVYIEEESKVARSICTHCKQSQAKDWGLSDKRTHAESGDLRSSSGSAVAVAAGYAPPSIGEKQMARLGLLSADPLCSP